MRVATLFQIITGILSTMPAGPAATQLTSAEYDALTRAALARIECALDDWLQADVVDIDSQRSGGLLELTLPGGGKVVINTQPPLQELWLAARSGGRHFRYVHPRWVDTRNGDEFFAVLSRELSAQAGTTLSIDPPV
jgi:CyaY protein